ncbi:MAG: hypothetical protein OWQ59_08520 [Alicyclobacillaceae bacterium]|nr:hypothetical protein [Alicyclobacillaceae bacterium]
MNEQPIQGSSVKERCIVGIQELLDRVSRHLSPVEKFALDRGIQLLYPRLLERIRSAQVEDVESELTYLRDLLNRILPAGENITEDSTVAANALPKPTKFSSKRRQKAGQKRRHRRIRRR